MQFQIPAQQHLLQEWLAGNRGDKRYEPTKVWKEWWVLHSVLSFVLAKRFLGPNFFAFHEGASGAAADFRLQYEDQTVLHLDATEATPESDRREIALLRRRSGTLHLGSMGGRDLNDFDWELGMATDLKEAIHRKSRKRYGERMGLLIYPNSNACFAETEDLLGQLEPLGKDHPFEFALVTRQTALIALSRNEVCVEYANERD